MVGLTAPFPPLLVESPSLPELAVIGQLMHHWPTRTDTADKDGESKTTWTSRGRNMSKQAKQNQNTLKGACHPKKEGRMDPVVQNIPFEEKVKTQKN